MADAKISLRIDLTSGARIGPGKIALLEAIRDTGSISAAARHLGMSYRRAWLLVEQINDSLRDPAVATATGGERGGGALLTAAGEQIVAIYRKVEKAAQASVGDEGRSLGKLVRGVAKKSRS